MDAEGFIPRTRELGRLDDSHRLTHLYTILSSAFLEVVDHDLMSSSISASKGSPYSFSGLFWITGV